MRIHGSPLPPGQRDIGHFPRFGTHLHEPPAAVPAEPVIEIAGPLTQPVSLRPEDLDELPQHEQRADFHCVAGWSATDLVWGGVSFKLLWERVVEPRLSPGATVSHLVLIGLDGYHSTVLLEDALHDDVLIAQRLDREALDGDHGAPFRFVSPSQYGFVSTKHLCRIVLHETDPQLGFGAASGLARRLMLPPLFSRHPRSRVWREERNATLPARVLRPIYRLLTPPIGMLSKRGRATRS